MRAGGRGDITRPYGRQVEGGRGGGMLAWRQWRRTAAGDAGDAAFISLRGGWRRGAPRITPQHIR